MTTSSHPPFSRGTTPPSPTFCTANDEPPHLFFAQGTMPTFFGADTPQLVTPPTSQMPLPATAPPPSRPPFHGAQHPLRPSFAQPTTSPLACLLLGTMPLPPTFRRARQSPLVYPTHITNTTVSRMATPLEAADPSPMTASMTNQHLLWVSMSSIHYLLAQ